MNHIGITTQSPRTVGQNYGKRARDRQHKASLSLRGVLGYSNAVAAGDALRRSAVKAAEIEAQHGPQRLIFLDGQSVPVEQQYLSKAEIRRART